MTDIKNPFKGCEGCYWFIKKVCHSLTPRDTKPTCFDTPEDVEKRGKKIG